MRRSPGGDDAGRTSSGGRTVVERAGTNPSSLESFWEQADADGSNEHPLEREIAERVDALSRYRTLIEEAQAGGRDDLADLLLEQQERQEAVVQGLRKALKRMRSAEHSAG